MHVRTLPTSWGIAVVRLMAGIIIFWASIEKFQAGGPANFAQSPTLAAFPMPAFWGFFIPMLECIDCLVKHVPLINVITVGQSGSNRNKPNRNGQKKDRRIADPINDGAHWQGCTG